jgi:drug/metabolite transporter (DMT)-like permease
VKNPELKNETTIRPVLVMSFGVFLFSVLDALMKIIATAYPVAQATGMRYVAGAVVAVCFYFSVERKLPEKSAVYRSLPRSLANLLAGACFFLAISRLPLVDAVTLTFLSPLFLSLWAWLILREAPKTGTIAAIIVGFVGVLVVARGQIGIATTGVDLVGFSAAIATPALYALSMVLARNDSAKDSVPVLVLLPSLVGTVLSAPFMIASWQSVSLWHYAVLLLVGVFGTAGYLCLTWAYSNARVERVGLLDYSGLLWGALFGYFLFNETPSISTICGAALIVGACVPTFFRKV